MSTTEEIDRLAGLAAAAQSAYDEADAAENRAADVRKAALVEWNAARENLEQAVHQFVLSKLSSDDGSKSP